MKIRGKKNVRKTVKRDSGGNGRMPMWEVSFCFRQAEEQRETEYKGSKPKLIDEKLQQM